MQHTLEMPACPFLSVVCAENLPWAAPYGVQGDRSSQVPPNYGSYHSNRAGKRRSSLSLQLSAGGGESGFESDSSAFLFGGRRVGAGFGVAVGTASSSSSNASARRQPALQPPHQRQTLYQPPKNGDVTAVAWDSGSQKGSNRVGRSGRYSAHSSPLLADRRPASGVLGAADGAPPAAFSLQTDSESESVLGGRGMVGADIHLRRGREGAAAMEARVNMGGGGFMADQASLLSGAAGRVMDRSPLPRDVGETRRGRSSVMSSSSSSSSSGYASSDYRRRRREGNEICGRGGSSGRRSSDSSGDDDVRDGGGGGLRGRPPSSHTRVFPPSMGAFEGDGVATRRARRHESVSSSNSSTSDENSSNSSSWGSSRSRSCRKGKEGWSVASGGRWRGSVREQRSSGSKTTAGGMRAAGWGGGSSSVGTGSVTFGSVGSGSFVGEGVVGGFPAVSAGIVGGGDTASSLRRRRFGQEA